MIKYNFFLLKILYFELKLTKHLMQHITNKDDESRVIKNIAYIYNKQ